MEKRSNHEPVYLKKESLELQLFETKSRSIWTTNGHFESSPAGITAAYRAGCMPVMIPDQDEPTKELEQMLFAKVERLDFVVDLLENM